MHETATIQNETAPQLLKNPAPVVIAYLLHLAVPAFLLVDIVSSSLRGQITPFQGIDVALKPVLPHTVVAAISGLWLAVGLAFFFVSRNRETFVKRVSSPLLSIYSVYLALALVEAFGYFIGLHPPIPTPYLPLTKGVLKTDPASTPGVSGTKVFTINPLGLRGPMPPKHGPVYRIVAVGGSTTICANLDDSEEWPHMLMSDMNASRNAVPVWVGNAGGNGRNTINHVVLMQWLPGVLHFDMAIFLVGVNDLANTLAFEGAPTQKFLEHEAAYQGGLPSGTYWRSMYPLYARLRLFSLIQGAAQKLKRSLSVRSAFDSANVAKGRERRAAGPVAPLPDLSTGLREYHKRILTLVNECRSLEIRCLFLTQPTMWRNDLTPREEGLLWTGRTGQIESPRGYVSSAELARAMDLYNHVLLDVCRESGSECFDIASHIPKDTSVFWDEDHYNESGARLMAQTLKQYLLSTPPFDVQSRAGGGK